MIHSPAARPTRALSGEQFVMLHHMLEEQRRFRIEQLTEPPPQPWTMSEAEFEVHEAILHGAQLALADVQAALDRMRQGTYGKCVHCGVQLPAARLEVVPQAALCMECQQRADLASR
ncbi:MAG TPA: TraR/DksA family transcriptional regulator [Jatrophihabitantaceae bacterium]|jgi:DnaK suppressor protein